MKKALLLTLALAAPLPASAQHASDPIMQEALRLCRGMPACASLVRSRAFPAEYLVACAQALGAEPEGPIKAGARTMCNTAFEQVRKNAVAQR